MFRTVLRVRCMIILGLLIDSLLAGMVESFCEQLSWGFFVGMWADIRSAPLHVATTRMVLRVCNL